MAKVTVSYQGELRCETRDNATGTSVLSDAPAAHGGKAEYWSPTEMLAGALGSCILTVAAIMLQRTDADLSGTTVTVDKEMKDRGISRLAVRIHVPRELTSEQKRRLEQAVRNCPVHGALNHDIDIPVEITYG